MSQHFLLTRVAKTLALAQVMHMTDAQAEELLAKLRWPATNGAPTCPTCGGSGTAVCNVRRPNSCPRWRCKADNKEFSVTSGTLFASRKLPLLSAGHRGVLQRTEG